MPRNVRWFMNWVGFWAKIGSVVFRVGELKVMSGEAGKLGGAEELTTIREW